MFDFHFRRMHSSSGHKRDIHSSSLCSLSPWLLCSGLGFSLLDSKRPAGLELKLIPPKSPPSATIDIMFVFDNQALMKWIQVQRKRDRLKEQVTSAFLTASFQYHLLLLCFYVIDNISNSRNFFCFFIRNFKVEFVF